MREDTTPTDAEIESLAIEHEAFGFGLADSMGLSTHGFDPDGMRAFARAVLEKWGKVSTSEPVMWAYKYTDGTWHDASATEHSAGMMPLYEGRQ